MKNKKRKGFTLVELLVVIAIVAILVTVGILGYTAFTKNASKSNDEAIISQMNIVLEDNEKVGKKANYPTEAVRQCIEEGFIMGKLTPSVKDDVFAYDKVNNRFIILNNNYELVFSTIDGYKFNEVDPNNVFIVVGNQEELEKANEAKFSTYLKDTFNAKSINTNKGIDVGECKGIEKVDYTNDGNQQTSLIYTNDFKTLITVQGESDTIYHYGYSAVVDVKAVNGESYHECGVVGRLTISKGHVVVEENGTIFCLMHKDGSTYDPDNICNIALTGEVVLDCKANKHEATRLIETDNGVYEFCEHCGYSLVTIELSNKNRIKQTANVLDDFGQVSELHVTPVELYYANTDVIPDGNFDLSELSLTSFDNDCEHVYKSQVVQEASCVQQGIISFTCEKCGHQYVVKTQKKSHIYGKMTVIEEPTLKQKGYGEQTCKVCGYVRRVDLPKLTEEFGDVGSGTKEDPYQVDNEVFEEFVEYVNSNGSKDVYVVLSEDITLSKNSNWVAIGTKEHPFEGSFDGKDHKIIDLTIKQNSDDKLRNVGLFGFVSGGTKDTPIEIKNVNVEKAEISAYSDCAGLVSRIEVTDPNEAVYVKISNVTISGDISGKWNVAGLVGTVGAGLDDKVNLNNPLNEAKDYKVNVVFENCTNNANVTGSMSVAGILGASGPGALPSRFNTGGSIAGGSLKFVNCTNNGKITYEYNAAGICAHINQASSVFGVKERTFEFSNCVNNGQIVASCNEGEYTYDKGMTGVEREKLMKSYQAAYSLFLDYSDYPSQSGNQYKEIACYLNCVGDAIKPIKWVGERKVYTVNYTENKLIEETKSPTSEFVEFYNSHK